MRKLRKVFGSDFTKPRKRPDLTGFNRKWWKGTIKGWTCMFDKYLSQSHGETLMTI